MLNVNAVSPYVRAALTSTLRPGLVLQERALFDYELIWFISGGFCLLMGGKTYQTKQGDVILIPPGVNHTILVPPDTALLMLLRPISGSAALAAAAEIIRQCGPDSLTGRTAAVMIGSSETTLYVAAVYFAAAGVRRSRWAVPAALCADLACFLSSAWICRILWG